MHKCHLWEIVTKLAENVALYRTLWVVCLDKPHMIRSFEVKRAQNINLHLPKKKEIEITQKMRFIDVSNDWFEFLKLPSLAYMAIQF